MKERMIKGLGALAIVGGAGFAGHEAFAASQPKPKPVDTSIWGKMQGEVNTIKSGNFSVDALGEHVVFTKKK